MASDIATTHGLNDMTLSQSHVDALQEQLAPGEQVVEHYSTEDTTVAVTDRRILRVTEPGHSTQNRETQKVRGVFFTGPQVLGVTVNMQGDEGPDQGTIALGVFIGIIGLVIGGAGLDGGNPMALIAFLLAIAGAYIIYEAYQTDAGEIHVTIHTTADEDEIVKLPLEAVDLARSIPAEVGAAHGREMTVATA